MGDFEEIPKPAPRRIFHERQRITALPLYFEGFLSIRRAWHQEFKHHWTELRGTTLFFYNDKKTTMYFEKLDLRNLTSVTNISPENRCYAQFILTLSNEEIEMKVEDYENGEEWKGFILTATKLSVPVCTSLLPGQQTRMNEVLEKEKKRRTASEQLPSAFLSNEKPHNGNYTNMMNSIPECYYEVSRQEAIELLEKNPSLGNLILRPGSDSKNYSISIRYLTEVPCIKHYKVVKLETGYKIQLERPVMFQNLHDVINYFVKETRWNLKPLVMHTYDNKSEALASKYTPSAMYQAIVCKEKEKLHISPDPVKFTEPL
ncbi:PREDICTED: signal-transducing adaptor protein 1 [Crocodylus porosus]|uniref:signal-transducing adaptor protein 1 n=1 Tax=Crocodylus porosus TaxID=8502 RepID=UPI0009403905|nr:PREDICTED: signal-transducing adaptor protein 1 [Crocodylus porosus]